MLNYTTNKDLSLGAEKLLNVAENDMKDLIEQYNVTPMALHEMLANIQEWYTKQPHLPQGQLYDQTIIRHLITRDFSVECVKEKIDHFYTAKHKMPELLTDRDPMRPQLEICLKRGYWVTLPQKTPENHRITILRIKNDDKIIINDLLKVIYMIGEYRLWNDVTVGEHWILDLNNTNFQHALQMTPVLVTNIMYYLTKCLGPKIKGIHLVNMPHFGETALNLFKKFLKAKVIQRIHSYSNIEDAMKKFPKSIIPKDFGGNEISCQEITDNWMEILKSPPWRRYFIEHDKVLTDESKRQKLYDGDDTIFGVVGSFRKLNLD